VAWGQPEVCRRKIRNADLPQPCAGAKGDVVDDQPISLGDRNIGRPLSLASSVKSSGRVSVRQRTDEGWPTASFVTKASGSRRRGGLGRSRSGGEIRRIRESRHIGEAG